MGNTIRMIKHNSSIGSTTVPILDFHGSALHWYRVDDGVMGGRSETFQDALNSASSAVATGEVSTLRFSGTINTNGGGFASIRANLPGDVGLPSDTDAIRLKYRGDGKTYKVLLSDGKGGGPFSSSPSWQADLPTEKRGQDDPMEEAILLYSNFFPSFGGRAALSEEERKKYTLVSSEMKQIGLMLSLLLADGSPNPKDTFGEGIFDFGLEVEHIEAFKSDGGSSGSAAASGNEDRTDEL